MTGRKSFRRYVALFSTFGSLLAIGPVAPVAASPEPAVEGDPIVRGARETADSVTIVAGRPAPGDYVAGPTPPEVNEPNDGDAAEPVDVVDTELPDRPDAEEANEPSAESGKRSTDSSRPSSGSTGADVGDVPLARTGYRVLALALIGTASLLTGIGLLATRRA